MKLCATFNLQLSCFKCVKRRSCASNFRKKFLYLAYKHGMCKQFPHSTVLRLYVLCLLHNYNVFKRHETYAHNQLSIHSLCCNVVSS